VNLFFKTKKKKREYMTKNITCNIYLSKENFLIKIIVSKKIKTKILKTTNFLSIFSNISKAKEKMKVTIKRYKDLVGVRNILIPKRSKNDNERKKTGIIIFLKFLSSLLKKVL